MKEACEIYLASSGNSPANYTATDTDSDEELEDGNKDHTSLPRIPKVHSFYPFILEFKAGGFSKE